MHNQKCVSLAIFHSYLHASARIFHAAAIDFNKSGFRYLYQFPKMPYLHFSLLQTAKQRDNLYSSKQIPHENQSDGTRENVPRRSRELFFEGQRSRERTHYKNGGYSNDILLLTRMDRHIVCTVHRPRRDYFRMENTRRTARHRRGLLPRRPRPARCGHRRLASADQPFCGTARRPERPELENQHGPDRMGGRLDVHSAGSGVLLPAEVPENGRHDHPVSDGGALRQRHQDDVLGRNRRYVLHPQPAGHPLLGRRCFRADL